MEDAGKWMSTDFVILLMRCFCAESSILSALLSTMDKQVGAGQVYFSRWNGRKAKDQTVE